MVKEHTIAANAFGSRDCGANKDVICLSGLGGRSLGLGY